MTAHTAQRIQDLQESSTIRMAKLSRELRNQGKSPINLSLGEPDFQTPDHIKRAAINAINEGYTQYPPVAGYAELREAVAQKFNRDNGISYEPAQIIVSTGAKQSLINIVLSIVNPGDEVIIPAPYWVTYPEMVKLAGGKSVFISTDVQSRFKINPQQLEAAITPRTRAFLFSSPSNPTGTVYSHDELAVLAQVFERHSQVMIISDEIYEHINYSGRHVSFAQFPALYDRVAVVNGVAKAFAMTGWRIGYMAGPLWLSQACEKLQGQFTSGANSIAQRATIEALNGDMTPTVRMREAFLSRRNLIVERLKGMAGVSCYLPDGAFYVFPEVMEHFGKSHNDIPIRNSEDLCMYLLEEAQVVLVPGDGFGNKNCIRISYAASESDLQRAMDLMELALNKLS
ncbi:MAG: pyridoxal phosphate-dependent aminotransferase [Bacteroidota bacterium]|nr:pyridoxal phosphate-dependent aminotransferase [Bacteroidota bacterium]